MCIFIHHHVHKSLSLHPTLNHFNPVYLFPPYFYMINFNIILSFILRSFKQSLHIMVSEKQFAFLTFQNMALYPAHLLFLDLRHTSVLEENYKKYGTAKETINNLNITLCHTYAICMLDN